MMFVARRIYESLDLDPRACFIEGRLQTGNLRYILLLRRWRVWRYEQEIFNLEMASMRFEEFLGQGYQGIVVMDENVEEYKKLLERIEAVKNDLYVARAELAVAEKEMQCR